MSYRPKSETDKKFCQVMANLHRQLKFSEMAMMTILSLCETEEEMRSFMAWVSDHIPDMENIRYDEYALMAVANDAHKGVPIRTLSVDKT